MTKSNSTAANVGNVRSGRAICMIFLLIGVTFPSASSINLQSKFVEDKKLNENLMKSNLSKVNILAILKQF